MSNEEIMKKFNEIKRDYKMENAEASEVMWNRYEVNSDQVCEAFGWD